MADSKILFPYENHATRLNNYKHFERLFDGKHFDAFAVKIKSPLYAQQYAKLKYVSVNFAGLISRVCADMLFGEGINIVVENTNQQKWINNLVFENKLETQFYESALINSRLGDDLFKVRSAPQAGQMVNRVIVEEQRPDVYFPKLNKDSWRDEPEYQELGFVIKVNDNHYLRVERHYVGYYENHLYSLEGSDGNFRIGVDNPDVLQGALGLEPYVETGIDRSLIIHVPNWRAGNYWGISDYADLETLMYALNNRVTKNENVLDKHTDPILALPEGVLDEKGKVKKESLEVFTIPDNELGGKPARPEYITWNASLDNSFKQIEKLVEFLYMTSEISPATFGMDKDGQAESGRALKLKMMRTLAKINRKKRFYNQGIKEAMFVAQLLAQAHGFQVMGERMPGTPELVNIGWQDGLPIDEIEQVEVEGKRLESGLQTTKDALIRIDNITEEEALAKAEEISKEQKVPVPAAARTVVDGEE